MIVSSNKGSLALPNNFNGTALFFGHAALSLGKPIDTHDEAHCIIVEQNNNYTLIGMIGNSHVFFIFLIILYRSEDKYLLLIRFLKKS